MGKVEQRMTTARTTQQTETRRQVLTRGAKLLAGGLSAQAVGSMQVTAAEPPAQPPFGTADHCIFLWLGGGAAQIDTWDPKAVGDPKQKKAGSYYPAIPTAIAGASVCAHLKRTAPLLDRAALIRTVHHDVIDEHAAAVNRMHTGRPTSGTVVYPSLGSIVAAQRGSGGQGVPRYVVMGYPNLTRGPGFLGPKHSYIYLTETSAGPAGLQPPTGLSPARQQRRNAILGKLQADTLRRHPHDERLREWSEISAEAMRLAGPAFMNVFQLDKEPADLRNAYGAEFGQRCLLARRLVERGVRFVEVSHNLNFVNGTGWDTHNAGQLRQHELIDELDGAFSTLLQDLEQKKLLDRTQIVIATEFGRPARFDAGGGRGHQSTAFSVVLAGGGLRTGCVVGETDELAAKIVARPVSVPDLFATIAAALKIDPARELFAGTRPVPVTDGGQPVSELFA